MSKTKQQGWLKKMRASGAQGRSIATGVARIGALGGQTLERGIAKAFEKLAEVLSDSMSSLGYSILPNGQFEVFSRGTNKPPDGWRELADGTGLIWGTDITAVNDEADGGAGWSLQLQPGSSGDFLESEIFPLQSNADYIFTGKLAIVGVGGTVNVELEELLADQTSNTSVSPNPAVILSETTGFALSSVPFAQVTTHADTRYGRILISGVIGTAGLNPRGVVDELLIIPRNRRGHNCFTHTWARGFLNANKTGINTNYQLGTDNWTVDYGSDHMNSTGTYTVPEDGKYEIYVSWRHQQLQTAASYISVIGSTLGGIKSTAIAGTAAAEPKTGHCYIASVDITAGETLTANMTTADTSWHSIGDSAGQFTDFVIKKIADL